MPLPHQIGGRVALELHMEETNTAIFLNKLLPPGLHRTDDIIFAVCWKCATHLAAYTFLNLPSLCLHRHTIKAIQNLWTTSGRSNGTQPFLFSNNCTPSLSGPSFCLSRPGLKNRFTSKSQFGIKLQCHELWSLWLFQCKLMHKSVCFVWQPCFYGLFLIVVSGYTPKNEHVSITLLLHSYYS